MSRMSTSGSTISPRATRRSVGWLRTRRYAGSESSTCGYLHRMHPRVSLLDISSRLAFSIPLCSSILLHNHGVSHALPWCQVSINDPTTGAEISGVDYYFVTQDGSKFKVRYCKTSCGASPSGTYTHTHRHRHTHKHTHKHRERESESGRERSRERDREREREREPARAREGERERERVLTAEALCWCAGTL